MTLLERIQARLCAEDSCKRGPAYPGQRYCADHALRWVPGGRVDRQPEWLRRMNEKGLPAKDYTRSAA